jgi:hypothetical protein
VNLPDIEHGAGIAAQGFKGKITVPADAHQLISHRPTDVKRCPRFRTGAAMAGKDGMLGFQGSELEITKSVMLND